VDARSGRLVNTYSVQAEMSDADAAAKDEFVRNARGVARAIACGHLPLADVAARSVTYTVTLSDNRGVWERWLVSQRFGFGREEGGGGGGGAAEVPAAVDEAFRRGELALMPRGGVAALTDASDPRAIASRRRRLSCFLPLPVRCDLPVSVNGHFALDHESRRSLWQVCRSDAQRRS